MASTSHLLRKVKSSATSNRKEIRRIASKDLGKAAESSKTDWKETLDAAETALNATAETGRSQGREEWLQAMAREALLRPLFYPDEDIHPILSDVTPFPDDKHWGGKKLKELASLGPWVASMFLLVSEEPAVGIAYLGDEDTDKAAIVPSIPGLNISGRSMELSLTLAKNAFAKQRLNNATMAKNLLSSWAATGAVVGERVTRVEFGNKLEFMRGTKRRILIPTDSQQDLPRASFTEKELQLSLCADLSTAILRVDTMSPEEDEEDYQWPTPVPVMHVLVGGSYKACMAPILMLRPKRIVLWQSNSEQFQKVAAAIAGALRKRLGKLLGCDSEPEIQTLSSNNLRESWDALSPELLKDLQDGQQAYFNITSGNRIMYMAVMPFSQAYPNLTTIYRDVDAEDFALTFLRFNGLRILQKSLNSPEKENPPKNIDWGNLFKRSRPQSPPPEITADLILEELCLDGLD